MKLARFFEKFEQLADAPNAVAKMRELVLHSAVTGRLVSSAHEWHVRPLKSLATKIGSGATPAGGRESYFSEGVPLIRSMNVHFRGFDRTGLVFLSEEQASQLSNVAVQPCDVLLNITGASIGRVTTAPPEMAGARVNQHVTIIRPTSELLPRFLSMFLASPSVQRMIDEIQVGATRQALTKGMIEQFEIPLPPLAEQKRIVAKVDELMALCDRLEAQQQERGTRHAALGRASLARFAEAPTPANLDFLFHKSYTITPADLRKTILTLAVQGLLSQFDAEGETKTVGEHVEFQNGYAFKSEWFKPDGVRLCRNVNVSHGVIDWRETAFVSQSVAEEFARFALSEGDIVLSLDRPIITSGLKVARVRKDDLPCLLLQRVAKPVPKHDQLDIEYFLLWLNSPEFTDSIDPGRSNGVPHISTRQVQRLPFILPPLAEQRRIVAKVDQLMAWVDQLETQVSTAKAKSAALLDAVIHELLNPTAEIIDLPRNKHDPLSGRAAIGCYAIRKMEGKRYFGRTTAMKVFYLAEAHIGLDLGGKPLREAAGPFDQWIYRFEEEGGRENWFKVVESIIAGGKKKIEYRPDRALAAKSVQAEVVLSADQRKEFDRLLALFSDRTTEEAEIIATLFAAWNDFLIDGHSPSDDEIVREVRENWHVKKARFTLTRLRQWLDWLRQNALIPKGRLPHTVHQPQLSLN